MDPRLDGSGNINSSRKQERVKVYVRMRPFLDEENSKGNVSNIEIPKRNMITGYYYI